ncbi:hypothetical protein ACFL1S_00125 [Pseudomonadota bacterium]
MAMIGQYVQSFAGIEIDETDASQRGIVSLSTARPYRLGKKY